MRGPRKQVKTPGDMMRRAMANLKAARTLTIEARDSYRLDSAEYREANNAQAWLWNEVLRARELAVAFDAADAKRRAQWKQLKRRAA